ncbi:hypothetical protein FSST1_006507 [Fusarium sambucinum]
MTAPRFESKFYKVIERPGSITILSASNQGVDIGPGTEIGMFIDSYPDSINIFSEITTIRASDDPDESSFGSDVAKTISLSTTKLLIAADSKPRVSLQGLNGIYNVTGHDKDIQAANGKDGGTLKLFVSSWSPATSPLVLDVRGGNGATTNNMAIAAGTGGNGGDVHAFLVSSWATVYQLLVNLQKLCPPKAWQGDVEGSTKVLDINDRRLQNLESILVLVNRLGSQVGHPYDQVLEILAPASSSRSPTIMVLGKAVAKTIFVIKEALKAQTVELQRSCQVSGGSGGSAIIVKGDRGLTGKNGNSGQVDLIVAKECPAPLPNMVPVHPFQCQMQLEKAKTYFYFGDPESISSAAETAASLVHKLAYVLEPVNDEKLTILKALYEKHQEDLGIPGSAEVIAQLQDIYNTARNMLFQLMCTSVDYYGLRCDWVPRISAASFKTETNDLSKSLQDAEALNTQYLNAVKNKEANRDARKDILEHIRSATLDAREQLAELRDVLLQLRARVMSPDLRQAIITQRTELDFQIKQLEGEVFLNFSVSKESIKGAAMSVATSPSKESAAKEAAKLAWQGLTTIPDSEGVPVDKTLILEKLEAVSGDLQGALKEYEDKPAMTETGELDLNLRNAKLLITDSDQIEKFCKDFASEAVSQRAEKVRTTLHDYLKLVTGRNNDIVQYNLTLGKIFSLQSVAQGLAKQRASVQSAVFKEQDLTQQRQMAQLVENVYTHIRARAMRFISYYRRAIYFATLENPTFVEASETTNDAALSLDSFELQNIQRSLNSQLFDLRAKKGSDAPRFPSDYQRESGKFVTLDPRQLKELLATGKLLVSLNAVSRSSSAYPDFSGCADVRAYRVRFWLDGLTIKKDGCMKSGDEECTAAVEKEDVLVKVNLVHRGDSTFRDVHDQPHSFRHDEIHVSPSYRILSAAMEKKKFKMVDSGDIVNYTSKDSDRNTAFSAPSPFASWFISLEYLDSRLDLGTVTRARFEFSGTSRSFV